MPSHADVQLAHPLVTKKVTLLLALLLLLIAACDSEQHVPSDKTPDIEERLFLFAERYLPDEDLIAAVPPSFELDRIVRYGSERHRNPWITVGVRLDGPVYARAIYYVHIEREDAKEMYEDFAGRARAYARQSSDRLRLPRPRSSAELDLPNVCATSSGRMWACHSWKAKVYLVVQVGNDANRGRPPLALIESFGEVLDRNLPARFHEVSG